MEFRFFEPARVGSHFTISLCGKFTYVKCAITRCAINGYEVAPADFYKEIGSDISSDNKLEFLVDEDKRGNFPWLLPLVKSF